MAGVAADTAAPSFFLHVTSKIRANEGVAGCLQTVRSKSELNNNMEKITTASMSAKSIIDAEQTIPSLEEFQYDNSSSDEVGRDLLIAALSRAEINK